MNIQIDGPLIILAAKEIHRKAIDRRSLIETNQYTTVVVLAWKRL